MAGRTPDLATLRKHHPMTAELGIVVAVAAAFTLWSRVVSAASTPILHSLALPGGLFVHGLLSSTFLLAGLCLFTGAYAALRDIEVGLGSPTGGDLRLAGLALPLPAGLVGLTKAVGALTGVPYGSLIMTSFGADAAVEPVVAVTGLGLFVVVPSVLLLCHVVVQGSFETVMGSDVAVVATTAVTGFLLTSTAGSPSAFPARGKLAGAALFVLAVAVAVIGTERARRRWVRVLAVLPAILFVVVAVVSAVVAVESVAGAAFGLAQIAVLGLAAYAYDRTDTLVVPALAYASFYLTGNAVVFVFEAGVQGW